MIQVKNRKRRPREVFGEQLDPARMDDLLQAAENIDMQQQMKKRKTQAEAMEACLGGVCKKEHNSKKRKGGDGGGAEGSLKRVMQVPAACVNTVHSACVDTVHSMLKGGAEGRTNRCACACACMREREGVRACVCARESVTESRCEKVRRCFYLTLTHKQLCAHARVYCDTHTHDTHIRVGRFEAVLLSLEVCEFVRETVCKREYVLQRV